MATIDERKPKEEWNTILIFPSDKDTKKFLSYFEKAELRIQVCVFRLTYRPLADILLRKKREGLLVEILVDVGMYNDKESRNNVIERLLQEDLQIRVKRSGKNGEGHMHCKFSIIDEEAILTGSLNYTDQGLNDNDETVLVSTDERYVKSLKDRYRYLWSKGKTASEMAFNVF